MNNRNASLCHIDAALPEQVALKIYNKKEEATYTKGAVSGCQIQQLSKYLPEQLLSSGAPMVLFTTEELCSFEEISKMEELGGKDHRKRSCLFFADCNRPTKRRASKDLSNRVKRHVSSRNIETIQDDSPMKILENSCVAQMELGSNRFLNYISQLPEESYSSWPQEQLHESTRSQPRHPCVQNTSPRGMLRSLHFYDLTTVVSDSLTPSSVGKA